MSSVYCFSSSVDEAAFLTIIDNNCCMLLHIAFQALKEVQQLTDELQRIEDQLDAAESQLADINLQLEQDEAQADEIER